jgi:hypothetical protein
MLQRVTPSIRKEFVKIGAGDMDEVYTFARGRNPAAMGGFP